MATFQPSGTLKIGHVPFDNTYQHTRNFNTLAEQTSYFQSVCTKALDKATYTYIRPNNSVKVAFNAEQLYGYNYVMFQNSNYGTKWFYAFIVECNYINEDTTELVLELDVMQTWFFDYHFTECMVEREHVDNDRVGLHTNPEPEMPFNVLTQAEAKWDPYRDGAYVVAMMTQYSTDGSTLTPTTGSIVNGCYQGAKYAVSVLGYPNMPQPFNTNLEYLVKAGGAESLAGLFIYPIRLTNGLTREGGILNMDTISSTRGGMTEIHQISKPLSLGRYVPRNNKLLTYPYTFCRIESSTGDVADLKWELWEPNDEGFCVLNISSAIAPDAMCLMQPQRYGGSASIFDPADTVALKVALPCSWVNNAYQTWSAQNEMSNHISTAANLAMLAFPAARGASAAAKALTAGARSINKGIATKTAAQIANQSNIVGRQAVRAAGREATKGSSLLTAGFGAMGLGQTIAGYDRMAHTPNSVHGQLDGHNMYAQNQLYFRIRVMGMSAEYARIADDFLDMYGYQIDRVKKPVINSRPNWNYIKTANSNHYGNVPAEDMALINTIYDNGITFWHTADVGNYSLDNSI